MGEKSSCKRKYFVQYFILIFNIKKWLSSRVGRYKIVMKQNKDRNSISPYPFDRWRGWVSARERRCARERCRIRKSTWASKITSRLALDAASSRSVSSSLRVLQRKTVEERNRNEGKKGLNNAQNTLGQCGWSVSRPSSVQSSQSFFSSRSFWLCVTRVVWLCSTYTYTYNHARRFFPWPTTMMGDGRDEFVMSRLIENSIQHLSFSTWT